MATLVCTLETVPFSWDSFTPELQHELMRWNEGRAHTPESEAAALERVVSQLAYSPLTAQVAALGLYDLERAASVVYCVAEGARPIADETYKVRSEAELLEDFWDGAPAYDTFVSFNGRRFLLPFLLHRSAILGVMPSVALPFERNVARQGAIQHVDLLDQLTFGGLTRRHTLYHYCSAYSLSKPATTEAVRALKDGGAVSELAVLIEQNLRATVELYAHWREYGAREEYIQY